MTESAQIPRYICHKTVWALKMRVSDLRDDFITLTPEDKRFAPIKMSHAWAKAKAVGEVGYYIQYEDGYVSWSPVEAFEKGYTPLDPLVPNIDSDPAVVLSPRMVLGIIQRALTGMITRITAIVGGAYNVEGEDTVKQARAALALIDSELVRSDPLNPSKIAADMASAKPGTDVYTIVYPCGCSATGPGNLPNYCSMHGSNPKCGCPGFFHDTSCSDQNPIDPFGAISNPDNRERVRLMAHRLGGASPWRLVVQRFVTALSPLRYEPQYEATYNEAEKLLKDGFTFGQDPKWLLKQALAEWDTFRPGSAFQMPFEEVLSSRAQALSSLIKAAREVAS